MRKPTSVIWERHTDLQQKGRLQAFSNALYTNSLDVILPAVLFLQLKTSVEAGNQIQRQPSCASGLWLNLEEPP